MEQTFNKVTIISACPVMYTEFKPGIEPGRFTIGAGTFEAPSFFEVGEASFSIPTLSGNFHRVTTPAVIMADSIVQDCLTSQVGYDHESAPAIIWVDRRVTLVDYLSDSSLQNLLELQRVRQDRWFRNLVRIADSDYGKLGLNSVAGALQRIAARELRLTADNHPWIALELSETRKQLCPACGEIRRKDAVICHICKAIFDPLAFAKLSFAGVKEITSASGVR